MPTPLRPAGRARIQTFTAFENFDQLKPGVWDVVLAPTAAEKANQWLEEHPDYQVVDTPRFESRLIEVTRGGNRRTFSTTLTLLYVSTQFVVKDIRDGQEETPEIVAPTHPAGAPDVDGPIGGPARFSRLDDAFDFVARTTGIRLGGGAKSSGPSVPPPDAGRR